MIKIKKGEVEGYALLFGSGKKLVEAWKRPVERDNQQINRQITVTGISGSSPDLYRRFRFEP